MQVSMKDTAPGGMAAATACRIPIHWSLRLLLVAGAVLAPLPGRAQLADAWLHASSLTSDLKPFSARLAAMGGLEISVEDPQNRIDANQYSDNPAGLYADGDSSHIEQYSRYDQERQLYFGQRHSAEQRGSGVRSVVHHGRGWTLGIDATYGSYNVSQHDLLSGPDEGRFIRDFDLMYPTDLLGASGDRIISANIETPRLGLTYSRPVFHGIVMGGRFGYASESDAPHGSPQQYTIQHDLSAYQACGGALYELRSGQLRTTVGAQIGYSSDKVKGTNESALNQDSYDWSRPLVFYGGQALIRYGTWVHGIVDGRHRSYDGEGIARVNWAPQYYLNPLPADNHDYNIFKRQWSAFLSGLRRNEGSTRWLVDVKGTPVHVSASYLTYREYEWLRPNVLVLTVARALDVRRAGSEAAGGVSVDLPEHRGVLAAEVHVVRSRRVDFTGALPEIKPETISYHFGAEYRPIAWLPLRAGLVALRDDPDRLDAEPPVKGTQLTAGFGYDWAWIGTHLDVAWAHEHLSAAPGYPSGEIRSGDTVSVVARYLF
jgi:hypothetical protein